MEKNGEKKTEDINCIKTEILENSPLIKKDKTERAKPNYITKK
jgi:hypothetical protein